MHDVLLHELGYWTIKIPDEAGCVKRRWKVCVRPFLSLVHFTLTPILSYTGAALPVYGQHSVFKSIELDVFHDLARLDHLQTSLFQFSHEEQL